jgi:hypothetical protein
MEIIWFSEACISSVMALASLSRGCIIYICEEATHAEGI